MRPAALWLLLLFSVVVTPCAVAQFTLPAVELDGRRGPTTVQVEIARTDKERARGLMFREEMAADAGMLFIFERDDRHSFWMKNTYIPLDMIFIDRARQIVGIVENAEPLTTTSRSVEEPSRYVLEVNAGYCRDHGIVVGSTVRFFGIPEIK